MSLTDIAGTFDCSRTCNRAPSPVMDMSQRHRKPSPPRAKHRFHPRVFLHRLQESLRMLAARFSELHCIEDEVQWSPLFEFRTPRRLRLSVRH